MNSLGKVRPEHVKKNALELVELYSDRFTTDFQKNKEVVESLAQIPSAKLRNRIAGYITRLVSNMQSEAAENETAESIDEEDG